MICIASVGAPINAEAQALLFVGGDRVRFPEIVCFSFLFGVCFLFARHLLLCSSFHRNTKQDAHEHANIHA